MYSFFLKQIFNQAGSACDEDSHGRYFNSLILVYIEEIGWISSHFRMTVSLSDLGDESPLSHFLTASRETVELSTARKLNSFAMKLVDGTFL